MPTKNLNWETFQEHCFEVDEITVQETNPEQTYITIENLKDTPQGILAELFVLASDCDVAPGAFKADRYDGQIDFYPVNGQ